MRRPVSDDDAGAMDSLLDTMTNVVGILVIVLVVTQLGVRDAVERIADTIAVDPNALQAARSELTVVNQRRDQLTVKLEDLEPVDEAEYKRRLEELQREIAEKQRLLDQLLVRQKQEDEELQKTKQLAATAKKEMEEDQQQRDKLKKELKLALDEKSRLDAVLDETPERKQLPVKVVNLPNPRPAPEGASQITFICSGDKVYPLNVDQFRADAQKRAAFVVQTNRLGQNPAEGIDPERFVREFNERPLYDDYFRVEMTAAGATPRLLFHTKESGGETEQAITSPRSLFQRRLRQVDSNKYFIRFYVCTDSFDIYVTSRRVMSEIGLLAGWEPMPEGWEYQTNMGGPIRLGPPPKPAPKPKTPPPPAKPVKPPNVID